MARLTDLVDHAGSMLDKVAHYEGTAVEKVNEFDAIFNKVMEIFGAITGTMHKSPVTVHVDYPVH